MSKMYVLKYSDRDQSYNHSDYHGKFAGMDHNSGGYPYATELISNTYIWNDLDKVESYRKSFPCLDLYELNIELKLLKGANNVTKYESNRDLSGDDGTVNDRD